MAGLSRYRAFRNRLLANARFQRAAEAFWPTRWVARKSARRLFDLIGGFVESQVLAACLELDLLQRLQAGAVPQAELAAELCVPAQRFDVLVAAAHVVGLLEQADDGSVGLGELGAMLLGNPSLPAMIRHHAVFYRDLADPVALLRGEANATELAEFWPYAGHKAVGKDAARDYSDLMAATQPMVSAEILRAVSFRDVRHVADLGGGKGAFLTALARQYPSLGLSLVDLPAVASLARDALADAGLADRVTVHAADFLADDLPRGADCMTLVRIAHDHDDDAVLELFARIRTALPSGGRLIIAEPMMATPTAPNFGAVYFNFYLLAMGSGRPRRPAELVEMLTKTGFRDCQTHRTAVPMVAEVLSATA